MKLKEEFPRTKKGIYFDTAVMGLLPQSTINVVEQYTKELVDDLKGKTVAEGGMRKWEERKANSKKLFAQVIGATEGEIAFVPNCTTGVNTVLSMIPIKPGSNIVSTDLLFPMGTVALNQHRKGAELRFLKARNGILETRDFEKAIDDKTAIVYLDQPAWFNGLLFDIKAIAELAHNHGALLVVDATQSFGVLKWDIDHSGIDFAATSNYKWVMGGTWSTSAGYMYINSRHVDTLSPTYVTAASVERTQIADSAKGHTQYEFKPRTGIRRFEVYSRSELSYVTVENSLKVLLEHELQEIEDHVKKLDTRLVDGLLAQGRELQTPHEEERRIFLNVKVPDPAKTVKELASRSITVSARVGGVRISPHFYNKEQEVDQFLDVFSNLS